MFVIGYFSYYLFAGSRHTVDPAVRGEVAGEAGHVAGGVSPSQHPVGRVQDEALQLLSPLSPGKVI